MKNHLRRLLLFAIAFGFLTTMVAGQSLTKRKFIATPEQIKAFCTSPNRATEDATESVPIVRSTPPQQHMTPAKNGKIAAVSPITLGSASNVFTILRTEQNQVFANDALNTVGFVHRNNASLYGGSSGHLRYDVSIEGGVNFNNDIGVLNPTNIWDARFPSITNSNPLGNTDPNSSQLVASGAAVDGTIWSGHFFSQSGLSTSGTPSVAAEKYDSLGFGSFVSAASCEGHRGDFWKVACIAPPSSNYVIVRQYCLRIFFPPALYQEYGTEIIFIKGGSPYISPNIAFSSDGSVGWVALIASPSLANDSVLSPILLKTTDMGMTWTSPVTVNLNSIPWIADSLQTLWVDSLGNPASDGIATTGFDFDLTVDANGNPHMAVVVGSHVPGQPYALATGLSKFLADVHSTDGGITWDADYVSPILTFRTPTFGATSNTVSMDNYPQISRSEDGEYIFYSWADSDTSLVTGNHNGIGFGVSQNTAPNLRIAGLRVATGERTYPKLVTDGDLIWEGRSMFPTMAPTVLSTVDGCYKLPIVMAEMPAEEPNDPANFFYFGNDATLCGNNFCDPNTMSLSWEDFSTGATPPCLVGIADDDKRDVVLHDAYPNPTNGQTMIGFDLPDAAFASLELVNVLGQTEAVLANGEFSAGFHRVIADTEKLPSGIYFIRLLTDDAVISKRLVVNK